MIGKLGWSILGILLSLTLLGAIGSCGGQQEVIEIDGTSKKWSSEDIDNLVYFLHRLYLDEGSPMPPIPEYEWYEFDRLSDWQKVRQGKLMVSNVWFDIHAGQMEVLEAHGVDYDKVEPYSSLWMAWFDADLDMLNATSYDEFFEAHDALYDGVKQMHNTIEKNL